MKNIVSKFEKGITYRFSVKKYDTWFRETYQSHRQGFDWPEECANKIVEPYNTEEGMVDEYTVIPGWCDEVRSNWLERWLRWLR